MYIYMCYTHLILPTFAKFIRDLIIVRVIKGRVKHSLMTTAITKLDMKVE